jgi:hypothetical protein
MAAPTVVKQLDTLWGERRRRKAQEQEQEQAPPLPAPIVARAPLPYPTPKWMEEHRVLAARGDRRLCQTVVLAYEPSPDGPRRNPTRCLHLGRHEHPAIQGKLCNRHKRYAEANARGVATYWIRDGLLWAPGTLPHAAALRETAAQKARETWEAVAAGWRELYYRLLGERDALAGELRTLRAERARLRRRPRERR